MKRYHFSSFWGTPSRAQTATETGAGYVRPYLLFDARDFQASGVLCVGFGRGGRLSVGWMSVNLGKGMGSGGLGVFGRDVCKASAWGVSALRERWGPWAPPGPPSVSTISDIFPQDNTFRTT